MTEPDSIPTRDRKVCEVCGQEFDVNDLDQVFHHDANPHEPLATDPQT